MTGAESELFKPIIYGLRDPDRYVYHYTTAPTALKYILRDRTLLLNSVVRTNDPRETKNWSFVGHGYVDGSFESATRESISRELRRPVHLACFCADSLVLSGDHLEDILQRGLAMPRMWAHYGNNHKGFCLIFDKAKLVDHAKSQFSKECVYAGNVAYRNCQVLPSLAPDAFRIEIPPLLALGMSEYCKRHRKHYLKQLFFEKLEDWRDEREWRLVTVDDMDGPRLLRFGDALVGVVHGADLKSDRSRLAIELAGESAIEHIFLKWTNDGPWYELDHPILRATEMAKLRSARLQS